MTHCGHCDALLYGDLVCANNERSITYRCNRCDYENTFSKKTGALLRSEPTPMEAP